MQEAYNRRFEWLVQRNDCKQVPVGLLHAEKRAEVVLLYVFRIGLPASPFVLILSFSPSPGKTKSSSEAAVCDWLNTVRQPSQDQDGLQ